jgi:hypothetical protein
MLGNTYDRQERRRHSERTALHEYLVTEKGRDLAPALIALTAWGDRWSSPNGPPILYTHAACAGSVRPELTCSNCGAIDASEVVVRPGPGMPDEYLADRRPRATSDHR